MVQPLLLPHNLILMIHKSLRFSPDLRLNHFILFFITIQAFICYREMNFSFIVSISSLSYEYKFVMKFFIFWCVIKLGLLDVNFSGISNPPVGIGDGWYYVEYTKPLTFPFSSFNKKNIVFSHGAMSTVALIAQQYGSIFSTLCLFRFPL